MGLLTKQQNAQSYSTYVTFFGLFLVISSWIYLQRLDRSSEENKCAAVFQAESGLVDSGNIQNGTKELIFCDKLQAWRLPAVIGILIGIVDVLIIPFLVCCITCSVYRGSRGSLRKEQEGNDNDQAVLTSTRAAGKKRSKYDPASLPTKTKRLTNCLGYALWVVGPMVGTGFIPFWLYCNEALRTDIDKLYNSGLAFFVIAFANFMIYFQKFADSLCYCGQREALGMDKNGRRIQVQSQRGGPNGEIYRTTNSDDTAEFNPKNAV